MTTAQHHLEQAYACNAKGDWTQALQQCELAIQLAPDLADAHNLRGIILEQLGRRKEAIAAYAEAVRLDPDFGVARENLAEAQAEVRKLDRGPRKRIRKAVLWAAIAYGISFALIEAILAISRMRTEMGIHLLLPRGNYYILVLATFHYTLGASIGAGVLARIAKPARYKLFMVAGALGFGSAYLLTHVVQIFAPVVAGVDPHSSILHIVSFPGIELAVAGVCSAILMQMVRPGKDVKRLAWSALAGGTFVLPDLFFSYLFDLGLFISTSAWIPALLGHSLDANTAFVVASAIRGAIRGIVGGAMLGLAMARPGDREIG
jgi:hypothetical protein